MLSFICLFFTLISASLQSGQKDLNQLVSSTLGEFSLTVSQAGIEGKTVAGVVNSPINFTLALNHWQGDQLQLGWISNGVYVVPKDELGQKVVFRRGQTNQTIHLEANLIGVYSIRFFKEEEEEGERVWMSEEVELVVRRENEEGNQIITLVIFVLLGLGLFFMGMELDIAVVVSSMKVTKHDSCQVTFVIRDPLDLLSGPSASSWSCLCWPTS